MNVIHRYYCRSGRWRTHLDELLPWGTDGLDLGNARVLEVGSGPGQTTDWLRTRTASLTAVEADETDAQALRGRLSDVSVHHADGTALPFSDGSFDIVVCFTMLHHVPSPQLQDRLFREARRVLHPRGTFAGTDSRWGPLFTLAHLGDTMCLVNPADLPARLESAGFAQVDVATRTDAFRFQATTQPAVV